MTVKIYSTPSCVYCKMAKEYFNKNGVKYVEFNVASDLKARQEMFDASHQMGVPVIDVDGKIVVGFNQEVLEEALNLKK
jgi:glutaredoxin 3